MGKNEDELEKPGKCLVCGSIDTYFYDDIKWESDGGYDGDFEPYSAVRCKECHFEISSHNMDEKELIAIWNRLSLSSEKDIPHAE